MIVPLTDAECRAAAYVGLERRLDAMRNRRVEVYGAAHEASYWTIDIEAAAAEMALAKALDRYWTAKDSPAEDREAGDVYGFQVRHTQRERGSLIVHPRDSDAQTFVLVVGAMPQFLVAGWITGADAKVPENWRTNVPRPAFFVPRERLNYGVPTP